MSTEALSRRPLAGYALGRARMEDAIREGEELHEVLQGLLTARGRGSGEVAAGAIYCLVDVFDATRRAGFRAAVADRETDWALKKPYATLLCELMRDLLDKSRRRQGLLLLSALCGTVQAVRGRVKFRAAEGNVEPAAPLRVEIVALPATMAVQTVERDESDDIKRTITITTSSQPA